jgi:hypothetical protein
MIVISRFNNVVLLHSMLADCCTLKARSGAPWHPQDDSNHHDQSRYKFACYRNLHLLFLFLLFHCHCCHASFPHNVPFWTMQHNNNLALRLLSQRLQFQQGCSLSPCQVGIADCLVHYPTYSCVGHNSQQPHNVCHTL